MSFEDLILAGEVKTSHGLRGLLRVVSFARSEASFEEIGRVVLKAKQGENRDFRVILARPYGKGVILKLEGIDTRSEADKYKGAGVYFRKADLRKQAEDEYFWFELIGLKVITQTGEPLGVLSNIISTGGTDIFVVKDSRRELLIPASTEVVASIDTTNMTMTVGRLEGHVLSYEV